MWPFWGFGVYTLHVRKELMCHANWPFFHVRYFICTDHKKAAETRSFRHENVSWIEWNEFPLVLFGFWVWEMSQNELNGLLFLQNIRFFYLSSRWDIKIKSQEPFNISSIQKWHFSELNQNFTLTIQIFLVLWNEFTYHFVEAF